MARCFVGCFTAKLSVRTASQLLDVNHLTTTSVLFCPDERVPTLDWNKGEVSQGVNVRESSANSVNKFPFQSRIFHDQFHVFLGQRRRRM